MAVLDDIMEAMVRLQRTTKPRRSQLRSGRGIRRAQAHANRYANR
jgi:hypothetical protein